MIEEFEILWATPLGEVPFGVAAMTVWVICFMAGLFTS